MARTDAREQKKLEKAAERKAEKLAMKQARFEGKPISNSPSQWDVLECWVSEGWQNTHDICQVIVARISHKGEVAAAAFVVDLACLGIKNAAVVRFPNIETYRMGMVENMSQMQDLVEVKLDFVAKLLREAANYAKNLGFSAHKDSVRALTYLEGANPDAVSQKIPLGGKDGKPMFIQGPHDNVERIMAQLTQKLGSDGFNFILNMQGMGSLGFDSGFALFDDDDDDDDDTNTFNNTQYKTIDAE